MNYLIKRSDAIEKIADYFDLIGYSRRFAKILLDKVPSADRPKGEWKSVKASIYPYGYDVECSVCGHKMGSSFGYKYCPNCGSDNRERSEK